MTAIDPRVVTSEEPPDPQAPAIPALPAARTLVSALAAGVDTVLGAVTGAVLGADSPLSVAIVERAAARSDRSGLSPEQRSWLAQLSGAQYGFCAFGHHRAVQTVNSGRFARSRLYCATCNSGG